MAIIDSTDNARHRNRFVWSAFALLAASGVALAIWGLRPPPQIGPDSEVFATVDALFTAVTAKDERKLNDCDQRLRGLREIEKLPPAAADALDVIIAKARTGAWQSAAEWLYDFMKVQRRNGRSDAGIRRNEKRDRR